nr:sulfite exporter TauE/SafE family protein [uncultured Allomuricauda sp.]
MVFLSAIILGFLGSLHCLGMCGPIAFMLPLDQNNTTRKTTQLFIYHFGRLLAYGIIGLLFGFLGKGLSLFGIQQKLSIVIGVVMIALVLIPSKYVLSGRLSRPIYTVLGKLKSKLGAELKKKTPDVFLTIGFLNGFLPCGLVYMALLGAIGLAHGLQAGAYMILFGLGTIPLMTFVVFSRGLMKGALRQNLKKVIPVFVILIGILFIIRGLGLGIPYVSPKPIQTDLATATIECHQP